MINRFAYPRSVAGCTWWCSGDSHRHLRRLLLLLQEEQGVSKTIVSIPNTCCRKALQSILKDHLIYGISIANVIL